MDTNEHESKPDGFPEGGLERKLSEFVSIREHSWLNFGIPVKSNPGPRAETFPHSWPKT